MQLEVVIDGWAPDREEYIQIRFSKESPKSRTVIMVVDGVTIKLDSGDIEELARIVHT
jgi:hypothetical protein